MTLPVALAVLATSIAMLLVFVVPHAPRLFRHGHAPPRPRRLWVTLVVARELCTAGAAAGAAWIALVEPGRLPAWAAGAGAGALAYLVSEVVAPAVGTRMPRVLGDRLGEALSGFLAPLRRPLERPAVMLAEWLAGEPGLAPASVLRFAEDGAVEEDDEAALGEPGRALLARFRTFRQRPVRSVMTPRLQGFALPVDTPGPDVLAALRDQRYSRVPVYRGDRDNVIGVLYAKDLCGLDVRAPGFRLEPLLRPATFVPLAMPAGDAFRELRRRKVHLGVVVDEYGGVAGLVTMEDLLEELFGDIADEDAAVAP